MKLKESEIKLERILVEKGPDNIEVPAEETEETDPPAQTVEIIDVTNEVTETHPQDKTCNVKNNTDGSNNTLKKVTNIENEQINKSIQHIRADEENNSHESHGPREIIPVANPLIDSNIQMSENVEIVEENTATNNTKVDKVDISIIQPEKKKDDQYMNDVLKKNILSCVEKVARIEEMKNKNKDSNSHDDQVSVF